MSVFLFMPNFLKRKNAYLWQKIRKQMNTEYLNNFEEKLQQELLHLCTNYGMLDSTLLAAHDIDNRWHYWLPNM